MTQAHGLRHSSAVLGALSAALIWGASFGAMQFALRAHLGVGPMLAMRFLLGALFLGLLIVVLRVPIKFAAVRDGIWLGLVVTLVMWTEADGLRLTTTTKSGFITALYILFTPVFSVALGQRLGLSHALGALAATLGLFLLVHNPKMAGGGWNFGDTETMFGAVLGGLHIALTAMFSKRSNGWVLAFAQVTTAGLLSLLIALWLSAPLGLKGSLAALAQPGVWITLGYLGLLSSGLAFYLMAVCQAHLSATEAAILYSLEPVFAAVLAMSGWIPGIKEYLSPLQLLGGAIVILAMLLAELGPRFRRSPLQASGPQPGAFLEEETEPVSCAEPLQQR